jgi:hypothetical protein
MHEPTVVDDIGCKDRSKAALGALFGHVNQ